MLTQPSPELDVLAGTASPVSKPRRPFDAAVCKFLAALSSTLRADLHARQFPDLQAFAFWCRPAHIDRLKANYDDGMIRLGRGVIFHIAPANVPINAAYSLVFGLLAGNANIVRVSTRPTPQIEILCECLTHLFAQTDYHPIRDMTTIVRYPRDQEYTRRFSALCDGRMIWGGDATVADIRRVPLPARAVELAFADRYSVCVMNAEQVEAASEFDLKRLVAGFYNDTYLMDQGACSSPHLVLWYGPGSDKAKTRFWRELSDFVGQRYALPPVRAVDKYVDLLSAAIAQTASSLRMYENNVYVLGAHSTENASTRLRGRFGFFYERCIDALDEIVAHVDAKYQTVTYFGFRPESLADLAVEAGVAGIDRFVPVGQALDIDVIWDGHDIIRGLSRIIAVR